MKAQAKRGEGAARAVHPLSLALRHRPQGCGAAGGLRAVGLQAACAAQPPLLARLPGLLAKLNTKLGPTV